MMQIVSTLPTSQRILPLLPFPPSSFHFSFPFNFIPSSSSSSTIHFRTNVTATQGNVVVVHNEKETGIGIGRGFIDIGYLSNVHGLQGEICVKPTTDFPQLRFSTPGTRWLRQNVLGEETIQEVELEQGRHHPAHNNWILKFKGIDTVDQAKMLTGSTLLVTEDERPELEEGEFYTHDLVGMKVFLKESGELVGTVIGVFNSGANDLLQISLDSSFGILDKSGRSRSEEVEASGQLVLVPFVEAIVPDVDTKRREMHITPPKGLLEINLRFDERSKKERRQLEWKERKKFQKRLIAAKKKLGEIEQQHVFHGLRYGEKEQRSLLSEQIVGVNTKLLQEALQGLQQSTKRWNAAELVSASEAKLISSMQISSKYSLHGNGDNILQEKGLKLMSEGKMAIVLLLNEKENQGCICDPDIVENEATDTLLLPLQKLLSDHGNFVKDEDREVVPLILVSSAQQIESLRKLFTNNNNFAFDSEKVWFLEEEKLPVVSNLPEGQNKYKILMKSPWEILESPVGSGGFISLFSKHSIADNLINLGVEYVEICSPSERVAGGNSLLLGLVDSREANVGVQISPSVADPEKSFDMIFSMDFLKKLLKQSNKLQFDAIPKSNSFVEKIDKDWVTVTSSIPNSYELSCSIYSSLNACLLEKVCVVRE
ncbi:putative 16S rRNA processing protein RimM [Lupinus albus]|uniref:Putative 16S rRNA processing protein RimM n=1 Tax=Lupinus albus TaxID=3870 RepID=A0A6A4PI32_LUPAL|nr:putative 16S rRNA processing protein RimM [Lupinus albus]